MSRLIVCCLVPELGPVAAVSSVVVGCMIVRSMARATHQPTAPQFAGSGDAPNREITYGRTSLVRWSAFPATVDAFGVVVKASAGIHEDDDRRRSSIPLRIRRSRLSRFPYVSSWSGY